MQVLLGKEEGEKTPSRVSTHSRRECLLCGAKERRHAILLLGNNPEGGFAEVWMRDTLGGQNRVRAGGS